MAPSELMLSEAASGLRHLRFAREVAASLRALALHGEALGLDASVRALTSTLGESLERAVASAREHVKVYRDFKERERVEARALSRLRPALAQAGERERALRLAEREASLEARLRTLRRALTEAKSELRVELCRVLDELARRAPELVPLVAPPLARGRMAVLDEVDPDDDAVSAD
jgi:hypothetical protein